MTAKKGREAKLIPVFTLQHYEFLCLGILAENTQATWRTASPGTKQIQSYFCDKRKKGCIWGLFRAKKELHREVWNFLKLFLLPCLTAVFLESSEDDLFLGALLSIM